MDSGNRPVAYSIMYVRVPTELKWLLNYYKSASKMPSFNWAVRHLLETHPELAKMAAELYNDRKTTGAGTPT